MDLDDGRRLVAEVMVVVDELLASEDLGDRLGVLLVVVVEAVWSDWWLDDGEYSSEAETAAVALVVLPDESDDVGDDDDEDDGDDESGGESLDFWFLRVGLIAKNSPNITIYI